MKLTVDGRIPTANVDQGFYYGLMNVLRDMVRQINELTDNVMPSAAHSAAITGDTLVKTGPAKYRGFHITVVTAVGTIDIRDGVSAGGGTVIDTIAVATAAGTRVEKTVAVNCDAGIYVDYNGGATGTVVVLYE